MSENVNVCILISAGAEWRALLPHFPQADLQSTPYGNCFRTSIGYQRVVFMHGGWGKVAAAGSTQYAIDRWSPKKIVNLGTCGGFSGYIHRGDVVLAEKTLIYDIIEKMSDPDQAIEKYSVTFDLSWLPKPAPQEVFIGTMVSADRDLLSEDIPHLVEKYNARVADWESGAIAWIAKRNHLPCLILRAVTDLVDQSSGEAYGDYAFFEAQTQAVMAEFVTHLPAWLDCFA